MKIASKRAEGLYPERRWKILLCAAFAPWLPPYRFVRDRPSAETDSGLGLGSSRERGWRNAANTRV
jgi:hypothetical protein